MTSATPFDTRRDALADALRHVLADAFVVTALGSIVAWNVVEIAPANIAQRLTARVAAGRRAQAVVARQLLALDLPVALHLTDPAEVPRWMLATQSRDVLTGLVTLAAGISEFVLSIEAAAEVARDVPAPGCMAALRRLARREIRDAEAIKALAAQLSVLRAEATGRPN